MESMNNNIDCDNNLDLLSVYRYCIGDLYFSIISILKACKVDSLINSHIEKEIEVLERLSPWGHITVKWGGMIWIQEFDWSKIHAVEYIPVVKHGQTYL